VTTSFSRRTPFHGIPYLYHITKSAVVRTKQFIELISWPEEEEEEVTKS
jgi:hypothetical protein